MYNLCNWNLQQELKEAEDYLLNRQTDFTATYMQVSNLQYIVDNSPKIIRPRTVEALEKVLCGNAHNFRRQAFFLYKKAADALAAIVGLPTRQNTAKEAGKTLSAALSSCSGHRLRAAAEALGGLPVKAAGPDSSPPDENNYRIKKVKGLKELTGDCRPAGMFWKGRSLVIEPECPKKRLVVIKFARKDEPVSGLAKETGWMQTLAGLRLLPEYGFEIPEPVEDGVPVIYRMEIPDLFVPEDSGLDPGLHAAVFKTPAHYFTYPNRQEGKTLLPKDKFREIIARTAGILGHLASLGIIHTAVIPLFHNRVQRHRRQDRGLYQWRRGGRLDRWLESCRHPNISISGIRDFEHFTYFEGPARSLYEHIGSHALSLVLLAGSYCRNHDESRTGLDETGRPIDARDLFDRQWIEKVLEDIFRQYYEGFTGNSYRGPAPRDLGHLSCRLAEEMGVDRHMEEILRAAQQQEMSDPEFREFLADRGFSAEAAAEAEKGKRDISIVTGPHLGGFNQRISVPELTEYAASLSARCIMDRHLAVRFTSACSVQDSRRFCAESSEGQPC